MTNSNPNNDWVIENSKGFYCSLAHDFTDFYYADIYPTEAIARESYTGNNFTDNATLRQLTNEEQEIFLDESGLEVADKYLPKKITGLNFLKNLKIRFLGFVFPSKAKTYH